MGSFGEFILLLIRQFAGGPGPPENNLVRFGTAAIFWLVLLVIAWGRQRNQDLPREKLLVWGFGLALIRELIMFGLTTGKIVGFVEPANDAIYYYPLEHGLAMTSAVVVAGAYLQYALQDERISRRYIQSGILLTIVSLVVSFNTWPKFAEATPGIHFNESWESLAFHILSIFLIAAAIVVLLRKRDWLRITVSVALGFLLLSESLFLVSNSLGHSTNSILCPISNALHILAIPIFGYVYLNEMSIEKRKTQEKLDVYRDHLEELVDERTEMLTAQNEISDSLSQSLDLETILHMALEKVLSVLSMQAGLLFLIDPKSNHLALGAFQGDLSEEDLKRCIEAGCPYEAISQRAIRLKKAIQEQPGEALSDLLQNIHEERIGQLISVPLISKEKIIGTLTLGSKSSEPLDQTNLELLMAACNQIGMAVENAYLFQEAEDWADELSLLHQSSNRLSSTLDANQIHQEIAVQSARLSKRPLAFVARYDRVDDQILVVSHAGFSSEQIGTLSDQLSDQNRLKELCGSKQTVVINDARLDKRLPGEFLERLEIRSLMCAPVWEDEEVTDLLFILGQEEGDVWRSKEIELVESFISRATLALENANLYGHMEWAAALEERQRISADMHDGLAQMVSLVGLKVDNIAEMISSGSEVELQEAVRDIRETTDQALIEARKTISSLQMTPEPRKPLQEILNSVVREWFEEWPDKQEVEFQSVFSFDGPLYLPASQVSQIVPVVREAIINSLKHSNSSRIILVGEQTEDEVLITIEDDGDGFDIEQATGIESGHFGLKVMQARAERMGGKFGVFSEPGCGTKITLSWETRDGRGEKYRSAITAKNGRG